MIRPPLKAWPYKNALTIVAGVACLGAAAGALVQATTGSQTLLIGTLALVFALQALCALAFALKTVVIEDRQLAWLHDFTGEQVLVEASTFCWRSGGRSKALVFDFGTQETKWVPVSRLTLPKPGDRKVSRKLGAAQPPLS